MHHTSAYLELPGRSSDFLTTTIFESSIPLRIYSTMFESRPFSDVVSRIGNLPVRLSVSKSVPKLSSVHPRAIASFLWTGLRYSLQHPIHLWTHFPWLHLLATFRDHIGLRSTASRNIATLSGIRIVSSRTDNLRKRFSNFEVSTQSWNPLHVTLDISLIEYVVFRASSCAAHVGCCCQISWMLSWRPSVAMQLKDNIGNPSEIPYRSISALESWK